MILLSYTAPFCQPGRMAMSLTSVRPTIIGMGSPGLRSDQCDPPVTFRRGMGDAGVWSDQCDLSVTFRDGTAA
jgi:hypothetical protein